MRALATTEALLACAALAGADGLECYIGLLKSQRTAVGGILRPCPSGEEERRERCASVCCDAGSSWLPDGTYEADHPALKREPLCSFMCIASAEFAGLEAADPSRGECKYQSCSEPGCNFNAAWRKRGTRWALVLVVVAGLAVAEGAR
jgi:hypothetical protein